MVGETEEKYGECEEEGLPVTDKSEEAADLKKYLKMLQNSPYPLFFIKCYFSTYVPQIRPFKRST